MIYNNRVISLLIAPNKKAFTQLTDFAEYRKEM